MRACHSDKPGEVLENWNLRKKELINLYDSGEKLNLGFLTVQILLRTPILKNLELIIEHFSKQSSWRTPHACLVRNRAWKEESRTCGMFWRCTARLAALVSCLSHHY